MSKMHKRKIYFINKELQGKFIFHYFILLTLGSVLFIGIFSFFSSNTLSIVYENYQLQLGTTPGILFKKMLTSQWIFIVLGGIFISFITLRLTHRVAGPFYRFEQSLDGMIEKDLSKKIVLRPKDEGKNLAEKINSFNLGLSENLARIDTLNARTGRSIETLETALENGDKQEISALVDTIKQNHKDIKTAINDYTFNNPSEA